MKQKHKIYGKVNDNKDSQNFPQSHKQTVGKEKSVRQKLG